jgi:hypothetical protein
MTCPCHGDWFDHDYERRRDLAAELVEIEEVTETVDQPSLFATQEV